ncbi:MAG TPA: Txe/YoeB family addiction module toxin [Holosporales bacterium]|nr:Txe/YoeB family addiction module toxin [Holosporales bacterium]
MQEAFNTLQEDSAKFKELLSDIKEQPWAATGSGQPEVLKGTFKGHKGCISRRLNHEDRFVYKVTGPGEILILSIEGHYK